MGKLFVNKAVFWTRGGAKMSGKVKSIMSDHVMVVTPDGTQHIVSANVLSTKPTDKLALLASSCVTKTAAEANYNEKELQDFLVGLKIEINLGMGQVKVEAVDAPGAPGGKHSELLKNAMEAISGGQGRIRLTDDALDRLEEEKNAVPQKSAPIAVAPTSSTPPPPLPPPPPAPPGPPPEKKKAPPQMLGPMGS